MPYVTNGNIYAPVMMLAEKAADLVLGNTPLPPLDAPFFRHREGDPLYPVGDPRNERSSWDRARLVNHPTGEQL
jgi:choline dehydrogenase